MSDSISIELEPCTEQELAFYDDYITQAEHDEREFNKKQRDRALLSKGGLTANIISAGYKGPERREIWQYFNGSRWVKNEPCPAYCKCNNKGTCWICKLNKARAWADENRHIWEEDIRQASIRGGFSQSRKFLINGELVTYRQIREKYGRGNYSVKYLIEHYGEEKACEIIGSGLNSREFITCRVEFCGKVMTYREIAEMCGVSKNTVAERYRKNGKDEATAFFKSRYIDSKAQSTDTV